MAESDKSLENSLRFGTGDRKDGEVFSFREYLGGFGIVEEEDFQLHVTRVLDMERITGRKLPLSWYDPYKVT